MATEGERMKMVFKSLGDFDRLERNLKNAQKRIGELEIKNEKLERLAMIDPKTEILNPRGLDDSLIKAIKIADRARYGIEHGEDAGRLDLLSFAFLDLDDFGQYNKREGHAKGDELLKSFTDYINSNLQRPLDSFGIKRDIGRFGGDEFGIVYPQTSLEGALKFFDKLRNDPNAPEVSYTGGVVQYDPQKHFGDDSDDHHVKIAKKIMADASRICIAGKELGKGEIYADIDGKIQTYSSAA